MDAVRDLRDIVEEQQDELRVLQTSRWGCDANTEAPFPGTDHEERFQEGLVHHQQILTDLRRSLLALRDKSDDRQHSSHNQMMLKLRNTRQQLLLLQDAHIMAAKAQASHVDPPLASRLHYLGGTSS